MRDVKQEIRELVGKLYLVFFYKKYLQNFKHNVPKDMDFSFNFAWSSIQRGFVH